MITHIWLFNNDIKSHGFVILVLNKTVSTQIKLLKNLLNAEDASW